MEDGVWGVVSGGVGGVVWWRFGGGVSVVEFRWWSGVWSKITIAKEKRLPEDHSPYQSHIFPLYNRIGLTTHALTEISDLGSLYDVMRISKTATLYSFSFHSCIDLVVTHSCHCILILNCKFDEFCTEL